ncbi:MAG: sensor domain-containing phosphodiesterase [Erythrobacter sp.]
MSEEARLACLRNLDLAAMPDRAIFSRITRLTTDMLECPVSLVSIVDSDRQWFLGKTGFAPDFTSLDVSFCARCILAEAPMMIADARADARFAGNALVTGAPFIRSYLGVPIRFEQGHILGTLCAISPRPHAFDPSQIEPLAMLAQLVEQNIALHTRTRQLSRSNGILREASRVFRHAEQAANIGSWRVDLASNALYWSDQAHAIHGLATRQLVKVEDAISFYRECDQPMVRASLEAAIRDGTTIRFETEIRRQDGEMRRVRVIGERIDIDGKPESVAGIVQDCTEEYRRDQALKYAAAHDRLTGLFNRGEFDRRLNAAMAEAHRFPVTVAVLDLDGFKEVNDTLGHLAGDDVLKQLAARFEQLLSDDVFLARWGGDEFALLFPPGMDEVQVALCVRQLIEAAENMGAERPEIGMLSATCGIARAHEVLAGEEVIRRADLALYRGKQDGPGAAVCWDEGLEARQTAPRLASRRLREALDRDAVFAAYQPIIDLATRKVVALEALLRMPDGKGGVLAACDVFSALLDPGLSRRVSRMMLDNIVRDGPRLLELFGNDCRIGLNLSEADLREGNFAQQLLDVIAQSPLDAYNLTIEVTETMLLSDEGGAVRAALHLFDKAGCIIALDDFGTGFSSLSHLRRFPIRKLKIDREFIDGISHDKQSRLIIKAIVEMGRSLGIAVVAEGVETYEQEVYLRAIGCVLVQGYRYGRAHRVDAMIEHGRDDIKPARRAAGHAL